MWSVTVCEGGKERVTYTPAGLFDYQIKSNQFNSGNVAHIINMSNKRQTDTITNMRAEDIKAHKHSKNTVKVDRHETLH